MPPHWLRDLWAYWEWLERVVRDSGGFLAGRTFIEPDAIVEDEESDEWTLLDIRDHRLVFYDGTFLKFTVTVSDNLDAVFYEFHYAAVGGPIIWRVCRNGHRVDELGSEVHIHLGKDVVVACGEVDLEEVISAIQDRRIPGIEPEQQEEE